MLLNTTDVKIKKIKEESNSATFTFDPLPQSFGNTLGNSLRRVLLTSIKGGALTQVKFKGVDHQFTTMKGVREDVVEITLNLKKVRVKVHSEDQVVGTVSKKGKGVVTAGDIDFSSEAEVVNKDLVIANITDDKASFEAEVVAEAGVGYSPTEERHSSKIGVILLDALYSPVVSVSYEVEPTRLGNVTGLDKLTLTVETDGTISPEDAITQSATLLRNFYNRFADGEDEEVEEDEATAEEALPKPKIVNVVVEELPLPTRTINALKKQGIETLKELADKTDDELSDIKNLGEKSITEIKKLLKKEGLR